MEDLLVRDLSRYRRDTDDCACRLCRELTYWSEAVNYFGRVTPHNESAHNRAGMHLLSALESGTHERTD